MSGWGSWCAVMAVVGAPMLVAAGGARAQCLLMNPSFEVAGGGGFVFGGWNQFGAIARVTTAPHGRAAVRITGPNTGNWAVSGVWQALDSAPGERWAVSIVVSHLGAAPLAGGARAIVNVEWRDAGGNLLSYDSHEVATPSTPADTWTEASFQSAAAPAGTVTMRLVLGVLQGPGDPTPQVLYDLATCVKVTPSLESYQWNDFPSGRTVSFSGRTWRVKGTGYYGPGPNLFDSSTSAVWVDAQGRLHLTIRKVGANWYSSEVALTEPLGYGDYVFTTRGRLDLLDRNTVFGLFLWEYGACYSYDYRWWNPYNEIDVEFSRWGNPASAFAQFVAQPADWAGNISRFSFALADSEVTSHAMRWLPDRVEFRSWRGGPDDERPANRIATWTYTGPHIPRPGIERVHLNLWQIAAPAVTQEVVLDAVTFRPACPGGNCGALAAPPLTAVAVRLSPAVPNPFATRTRLRFEVPARAEGEIAVFDPAGRRVRRLVSGVLDAGEHAAEWDGRDEAGRRVAPGVYLFHVRVGALVGSRRVVVLDR
jgi:hypothetical protein